MADMTEDDGLSEEEIDALVIEEAHDEEAWEPGVDVRPPSPRSPAEEGSGRS